MRNTIAMIGMLGMVLLAGCGGGVYMDAKRDGAPVVVSIERKDAARFNKLIAPDAKVEILADHFNWAEGPTWVPSEKAIVFSDVKGNTQYKWKEGAGISIYRRPSGFTGSVTAAVEPGSNGLTVDSEGRLVSCEHGDRRVARVEKDGSKTTLADNYEGKRFNSPNDLVFKSNGDLYFTDPPYGLPTRLDDPTKEIPYQGVYRVAKDGKVTLLTKELKYPNGIAFSPDEKTLYVAQSDPTNAIIMAYPVKADGTLDTGKVFSDSTALVAQYKDLGLPDGMKVDKDGNVFIGGVGGLQVIAPDGTLLGTIHTGVPTANCAWGDDGSTLYITADSHLIRIKTLTKGKGF